MEQEAEALGTVGFLSTCLFPKPTHCPPACTTRPPREAPPEAPQPRFDRAATWGFSSCSHFYPLLTDEETGSEPGPGLSKACGGLEEAGCKPRLSVHAGILSANCTPPARPPGPGGGKRPREFQPEALVESTTAASHRTETPFNRADAKRHSAGCEALASAAKCVFLWTSAQGKTAGRLTFSIRYKAQCQ